MSEITKDDCAKALDRIARTEDGALLYRYLQRRLMGVVDGIAAPDSALRADHGIRTFAAELMALMAKGIDESGGSTGSSSTRSSERPVVFRSPERRPAVGAVSFREHARANDPEYLRIAGNTGDRGSGA